MKMRITSLMIVSLLAFGAATRAETKWLSLKIAPSHELMAHEVIAVAPEYARYQQGMQLYHSGPAGDEPVRATLDYESPGLDRIAQRIKAAAESAIQANAALTPADRAKRIDEALARRYRTVEEQTLLQSIEAGEVYPPGAVRTKLPALRARQEQLQMDRAAREARIEALRRGLEELQKRAAIRLENDVVRDQLQKLVELKENDVTRLQKLHSMGRVPATEVTNGEAALLEAKARLAEREAGLRQGGGSDLTQRVSDELAMAEIDMTELRMRLAIVENELSKYDPANLDLKKLEELASNAGTSKLSELQKQLDQRLKDIDKELFGLKILAVTEGADAAPAPAAPGAAEAPAAPAH